MGNLYPLEVAKCRWSLLRTISNSRTEKMELYILLYNSFLLSPLRFRDYDTTHDDSVFWFALRSVYRGLEHCRVPKRSLISLLCTIGVDDGNGRYFP